MKKGFLFLLLAGSFSATRAQSLKDLLYSGKLKNDGGSMVRKTDDLSTKIDTGTRRATEPEKARVAAPQPAAAESPVENLATKSPTATAPKMDTATSGSGEAAAVGTAANATDTATTMLAEKPTEAPAPAPVKSNSKLWKERIDALTKELQAEVLSNKKVKKETYFVTVDYELAEDGQVGILNVVTAPENEFLANQVKERLMQNSPVLTPQTDSAGKTRKVKRKQNFTVTKE